MLEGGCSLLLFKPRRLTVQCFSAIRLQFKGKSVWGQGVSGGGLF